MEEKVFEKRMNFWQNLMAQEKATNHQVEQILLPEIWVELFWAIRYLYKDLQEFHKWSDDQVWLELKNEIIKNSKGNIGSDDLDWIQAILTLKKDITLSEAKRMYERFKDETPLLDAIKKSQVKLTLSNLNFIVNTFWDLYKITGCL